MQQKIIFVDMKQKNVVVAIDGYSSCGKSTVAQAAAKELGFVYIDSGAMYRAIALYFLNKSVDLNNENQISQALEEVCIDLQVENDKTVVLLNDTDVSNRIREMEVSNYVPYVSAIKEVRKTLVTLQQKMGSLQNIIMDGRDIGSVVFPNADVKIFMTADPKIRAERRHNELKLINPDITLEEVFENIAHRDYEDTTRKESPLIHSKEAITLDNTNLSEKEQLEFVINEVKNVLFSSTIQ